MRRRRWHSAGRRWRHSIQGRLVVLFLLLALCTSAVFLVGMQRVLQSGWQGWGRPLIAWVVDALAPSVVRIGIVARDLATRGNQRSRRTDWRFVWRECALRARHGWRAPRTMPCLRPFA